MADDDTTLQTRGLDKIIKALKNKMPEIKVGVAEGTRDDGKSNALIGAVHEYGSPARNIPPRSFLRMPLTNNLDNALQSNGFLKKQSMEFVLKEGSFLKFAEEVGKVAVKIVDDAFETGGPGWPQWKIPTYNNRTGQLLIDTGQLRNSITYEVKE